MHRINKTKTIKSIFFTFALLLMVLFFTGCANVTYYVIPGSDQYTRGLKVSLSKQSAIDHGYNLETLRENVKYVMYHYSETMNTRFQEKLEECRSNNKITAEEYLFLNTIKPFQATVDDKETSEGYDIYFEINLYAAQNNQSNFSIIKIANIYNYADVEKPEDVEDEDTSFLEDIGIAYLSGDKQDCPFDNADIDNFAEIFLEDANYQDYGLTKSDVTYNYKFATSSKRLHSNADKIEYKNGYYIHTWNVPQDSEGYVENISIKLFYTFLNTKVWYWIGLGVTLVSGIIITIVLYNKNKQEKNNKIIISN